MLVRKEREIALPGPEVVPFLERTWVQEGISSVAPFLGATGTALSQFLSATGSRPVAFIATGTASLLVLGMVLRHKKAKKVDQEAGEPPLDLTACAQVAHAVMLATKGVSVDDRWLLRASIFRRSGKRGEELEQCIDYVGGDGDGCGRKFPSNSGVIGRAFQTSKVVIAHRKSLDYEQFLDEMVDEFNITKEEARNLRPDRWSWMAIPILGERNPVGVVFFDSKEPDFFGRDVQGIALAACEGIGSYIKVVYRTAGRKGE